MSQAARCRWPSCRETSTHYAVDDEAYYGHLCAAHWRGLLSQREREMYAEDREVEVEIAEPA